MILDQLNPTNYHRCKVSNSVNIYVFFLVAEVLIVMDSTGEILTYLWSFYQENILFYKPPTNSDTSEFPVGTLVRKSGTCN